jgi:hypothetical protein
MVKFTFTPNKKNWTRPIILLHSEDKKNMESGCPQHRRVNTKFVKVDGAKLFGQTDTKMEIFFLDVQSP